MGTNERTNGKYTKIHILWEVLNRIPHRERIKRLKRGFHLVTCQSFAPLLLLFLDMVQIGSKWSVAWMSYVMVGRDKKER